MLNSIHSDIKLNIREINKKICEIYFPPSKSFDNDINNYFYKIYHNSIKADYVAIHLRIGDVDNQPYKKYINKTEINNLILKLKQEKNRRYILLSDSLMNRIELKNILRNNIYTDFNTPCHSKKKQCLNQSLIDMMVMKNAKMLILTRGSTFSLFASYFSKCHLSNIVFIGHDYEHHNYYI